jgi:hypothetical protein
MIKLERPACPNPSALKTNYKHPDNKNALRSSSHDKCMYCESKISHIDYAHVEHYKPKSVFTQLEFEWNNLGYACPKCNVNKGNSFNINVPYLEPYSENPSGHIVFAGSFIFHKNGSERGELTIKDIELNRPELLERRFEKINVIQKAITVCHRTIDEGLRTDAIGELMKEANPDKEYSLCVKTFLRVAQDNSVKAKAS